MFGALYKMLHKDLVMDFTGMIPCFKPFWHHTTLGVKKVIF